MVDKHFRFLGIDPNSPFFSWKHDTFSSFCQSITRFWYISIYVVQFHEIFIYFLLQKIFSWNYTTLLRVSGLSMAQKSFNVFSSSWQVVKVSVRKKYMPSQFYFVPFLEKLCLKKYPNTYLPHWHTGNSKINLERIMKITNIINELLFYVSFTLY